MTPELAFDPVVPTRDMLLDTELVRRRLAGRLGSRAPLAVELVRAKYRIGSRLRVLYRVRTRSAAHAIAASTFPTAARRERALAATLAAAQDRGRLAPALDDSCLEAVFWTFPNDRKLRALPSLAHPDAGLSAALHGRWVASELVAWAPEKSATVRCLDRRGGTLAYAKVYAGEDGEESARVHRALAAALDGTPGLRLPAVLAYDGPRRTLLLEALAGTPVAALPAADLDAGYRRLGEALAVFHALPAPAGRRFTRLAPEQLQRAAELVGAARPDVAGAAATLAERLAEHAPAPAPDVCLHGDAHGKNALALARGFGLIDLDQAGAGPAAADLGGALAGLRYAARTGAIGAPRAAALGGALRDGYAARGALPDEDELRWHVAAALLVERAARAVSRLRPAGLRRLPELLADAAEVAP